jgi:hypothetical protein
MSDSTKSNGNGEAKPPGEVKPSPEPLKTERSLRGVIESLMEIGDRTVNSVLGVNEAKAATGAYMGVAAMLKVQLEAIKIHEKGSEMARGHVAKILELGS